MKSGPRGHRGNLARDAIDGGRLVRPTRAQSPSGSSSPCRPRLRAPHHPPPQAGQAAAGVGQPGRPGAKDAGAGLGRALGKDGIEQGGQLAGIGGHAAGGGGGAAAGIPQTDRRRRGGGLQPEEVSPAGGGLASARHHRPPGWAAAADQGQARRGPFTARRTGTGSPIRGQRLRLASLSGLPPTAYRASPSAPS